MFLLFHNQFREAGALLSAMQIRYRDWPSMMVSKEPLLTVIGTRWIDREREHRR